MNKVSEFLLRQPRSLLILAGAFLTVTALGFTFAAVVLWTTVKQQELHKLPICLSATCVESFGEKIDPALSIAKATIELGVAIATIGGIFVALLGYLSSASTAALTNHIEHLKVFTEYVEAELGKRERLSRANFDILLLYSRIFSQSRMGKTTVSDDYRLFVDGLNKIISHSNERCSVGTPGGFSYRDHQRSMRDHLDVIGVKVFLAPRNDFFEMEGQLLSLLHRISQSFCPSGTVPELVERKYY